MIPEGDSRFCGEGRIVWLPAFWWRSWWNVSCMCSFVFVCSSSYHGEHNRSCWNPILSHFFFPVSSYPGKFSFSPRILLCSVKLETICYTVFLCLNLGNSFVTSDRSEVRPRWKTHKQTTRQTNQTFSAVKKTCMKSIEKRSSNTSVTWSSPAGL